MISTVIATKKCPRCPAKVVAAYSEGVFVQCNPDELTAAQELLVLLDDRVTFDLLPHRELVLRDRLRLADPARPHPVLAEHDCPQLTAAERRRRRPYRKEAVA